MQGLSNPATETRNPTPLLITADSVLSCFQRRHFAQTAQVSFRLTELSSEKRLHQIPSDCRSHRPAAHAQDVHVIVLDSLLGGEVIVDERRADTPNFVGAHRRANPAATDGHTAVHLSGDYGLCEWNYVVGIVVAFAQAMGAEIYDLVPRRAQLA